MNYLFVSKIIIYFFRLQNWVCNSENDHLKKAVFILNSKRGSDLILSTFRKKKQNNEEHFEKNLKLISAKNQPYVL